jgi:hypothetical protein
METRSTTRVVLHRSDYHTSASALLTAQASPQLDGPIRLQRDGRTRWGGQG